MRAPLRRDGRWFSRIRGFLLPSLGLATLIGSAPARADGGPCSSGSKALPNLSLCLEFDSGEIVLDETVDGVRNVQAHAGDASTWWTHTSLEVDSLGSKPAVFRRGYDSLFGLSGEADHFAPDLNGDVASQPGPHDALDLDGYLLLSGENEFDQAWNLLSLHSDPSVALVADSGLEYALAEAGDAMPDSDPADTFSQFGRVATGPEDAGFIGTGALGLAGVYVYDLGAGAAGSPVRLVDTSQARPAGGSGNYAGLTSISIDEDRLLFTDAAGVYLAPSDGSGAPTVVAKSGDSWGAGTLTGGFTNVTFWGDRALFNAASGGISGVFVVDLGTSTLSTIANGTTPIPGGVGNFGHTQNPSGLGSTVVFEGFNASFVFDGLFAWRDATLLDVIRKGQVVDARTVFAAGLSRHAVVEGGDTIAFALFFTDDSSAVAFASFRLLFGDGFESGDLLTWSDSSP